VELFEFGRVRCKLRYVEFSSAENRVLRLVTDVAQVQHDAGTVPGGISVHPQGGN